MKKEPLKHQAYLAIREKIINCEYAPDTIINEELIRNDINASRTPIRDALSRLEQEGLVKILPKKGIVISDMSIKEVNMLYEARNLVEPYAVLNYGNRISQDIYMSYFKKYKAYLGGTGMEYSFSEMDDHFHRLFINAMENSFFSSLYTTIESQIRRTRVLSGHTSQERLRSTAEEHLQIVEALLKNDWKGAADAMQYHLNQSKDVVFTYILNKPDKADAVPLPDECRSK